MGIYRKSGRKSGNLDPKSGRPEKSGTVGRPADPDLLQNDYLKVDPEKIWHR
jgi:hypothetical protein